MTVPEETGKDVIHKFIKIGANIIPFVGGSIAETFNAIVTPPIEKRRNEWMEMVMEKLQELYVSDQNKLEEILNDEDFQSLLISSSINAFKTHQVEKKRRLRNGLLNTIESGNLFELNQQFINFIDVLSLTHIDILNHVYLCQDRLNDISEVEMYYNACKDGTLGYTCQGIVEIEISAFRFLLKDLETKGLVMLSKDFIDLKGKVFETVQVVADSSATEHLPFIQITKFGIDFLKFIEE